MGQMCHSVPGVSIDYGSPSGDMTCPSFLDSEHENNRTDFGRPGVVALMVIDC